MDNPICVVPNPHDTKVSPVTGCLCPAKIKFCVVLGVPPPFLRNTHPHMTHPTQQATKVGCWAQLRRRCVRPSSLSKRSWSLSPWLGSANTPEVFKPRWHRARNAWSLSLGHCSNGNPSFCIVLHNYRPGLKFSPYTCHQNIHAHSFG